LEHKEQREKERVRVVEQCRLATDKKSLIFTDSFFRFFVSFHFILFYFDLIIADWARFAGQSLELFV
jgi:hypothetical protein